MIMNIKLHYSNLITATTTTTTFIIVNITNVYNYSQLLNILKLTIINS